MIDLHGYDFSAHIHRFSMGGKDLLLDVNSGAIHLLDTPASRFVDELVRSEGNWDTARSYLKNSCPPDTIAEIEAEFRQAINEGSLFSPEVDLTLFDYGMALPKSVCLNVAHVCNMRCRYCFAAQGTFGTTPGLMPQEVANQTIDFLLEASGPRNNLELDFFGGEPLLNMAVVKQTVDYARRRGLEEGKHFNFTLTTNGWDLDEETRAYLIREEIAVILSLDGRPEVNDRMRILPGGEGTYERIVPRIQQMVDLEPTSYYVRGTFTAQNLDFCDDVAHFCQLGFDSVSLEPVTGGPTGIALGEEHLPRIYSEYEKLGNYLLECERRGCPVNFFHFNLDVNRGPCVAKRITGCGAGVEYLAVTPEGDVYPCHQFIGHPEFKMGHISQGGLDESIKKRFAGNTVDSKECRRCWARFYCGGGCQALAFFENQDLTKPFKLACAMQQKRLEVAFYMATQRLEG